tara:strand:+ start:2165 stop:2530 length:366 start_codon:yes stop_codon:yes gene_type:complete
MIKGSDNIHKALEKLSFTIEKTAKWKIPAAAVAGIGAGAVGNALFERHQRDTGKRGFGGYTWKTLDKHRKKGQEAKDPQAYLKALPPGLRNALLDSSRHFAFEQWQNMPGYESAEERWPWG